MRCIIGQQLKILFCLSRDINFLSTVFPRRKGKAVERKYAHCRVLIFASENSIGEGGKGHSKQSEFMCKYMFGEL